MKEWNKDRDKIRELNIVIFEHPNILPIAIRVPVTLFAVKSKYMSLSQREPI